MYLCKIFSSSSDAGNNYDEIKKALQINLNFETNNSEKIKEEYYIMSKDNKILTKSLQIWNFNMYYLKKVMV